MNGNAAASGKRGEIILDVSRLLSRMLHPTPTGIDRVEMAYACGLLANVPDRLRFAAVHPSGIYGRLSRAGVLRFLDETQQRWEQQGAASRWRQRAIAFRTVNTLLPMPVRPSGTDAVYLLASPHHLTRAALVRSILRRERARFICLVHDLIPIEFPEYARPDGTAKHQARIDTLVSLADGLVFNSAATCRSLAPILARSGRHPITRIAHLGVPAPSIPPGAGMPEQPYFVCVGTIEPRKNHLLLLNLWRRLREAAPQVPKLVLVGRRGWENEQVVDMLERCPGLKDCVVERQGVSDADMRALISGARALLLPSFAEGYGMPVVEALALGTPVICSDLPALREAGGEVPMYLDPLDGPGWHRAIVDYAGPNSSGRALQLQRMAGWRTPTWENHLDTVLYLINELSA